MHNPNETLSPPTVTTSEKSSKTELMTTQLQQELNSLLQTVNKLIVQTALKSVLGHEFASRQFRRQLQRKQEKHTRNMLRQLSDSEKLLLLEDLRSQIGSIGNSTPSVIPSMNSIDSDENSEESTQP